MASQNTTLLVACASLRDFSQYGAVAALHAVLAEELKTIRADVFCLFDVAIDPEDGQRLFDFVEASLHRESSRSPEMKWAPVAFQQVLWRFNRYWQYKLCLEICVRRHGVSRLVLSSGGDDDLVFAARAVAQNLDLDLDVQNGACDSPTSLTSHLCPYDLPDVGDASWDVTVSLCAAVRRVQDKRVFYQPTGHFGDSGFPACAWAWKDTVAVFARLKAYAYRKLLGSAPSTHGPRVFARIDESMVLDKSCWPGFDRFDLAAADSFFQNFSRRYPADHLSLLEDKIFRFFRAAKVDRLVVMQDTLSSARLGVYAAKRVGMRTDYLPHGAAWESFSSLAGSKFSPHRVLSWSAPSAAISSQRGFETVVISHPSNKRAFLPLRKRLDIHGLRVLVLTSEWIWTSSRVRPDCLESDFLEICRGLRSIGVDQVAVKSHWVVSGLDEVRSGRLNAIAHSLKMRIHSLDSHIPSPGLFSDYDLAILPHTTGILECMSAGTPMIVFQRHFMNAAVLSPYGFPCAETAEEVTRLVSNYPFDAYEVTRHQCEDSLHGGPHPLDPILNR